MTGSEITRISSGKFKLSLPAKRVDARQQFIIACDDVLAPEVLMLEEPEELYRNAKSQRD